MQADADGDEKGQLPAGGEPLDPGARRELVDRAGIEFDPNVVNVFLKLDGLPELESFAKGEPDEPVEETQAPHTWDMFSSYLK